MLFEFRWETFLNAPTTCMMQTSAARYRSIARRFSPGATSLSKRDFGELEV
ncbi:unnamed protein product [Ciceribacter sp. T2.26MG-112.2]|nr:unnamed protein product [Ciceribacter naphthalenivorans]